MRDSERVEGHSARLTFSNRRNACGDGLSHGRYRLCCLIGDPCRAQRAYSDVRHPSVVLGGECSPSSMRRAGRSRGQTARIPAQRRCAGRPGSGPARAAPRTLCAGHGVVSGGGGSAARLLTSRLERTSCRRGDGVGCGGRGQMTSGLVGDRQPAFRLREAPEPSATAHGAPCQCSWTCKHPHANHCPLRQSKSWPSSWPSVSLAHGTEKLANNTQSTCSHTWLSGSLGWRQQPPAASLQSPPAVCPELQFDASLHIIRYSLFVPTVPEHDPFVSPIEVLFQEQGLVSPCLFVLLA